MTIMMMIAMIKSAIITPTTGPTALLPPSLLDSCTGVTCTDLSKHKRIQVIG